MKPNYQAWDINIDDFYKITNEREKLKFLLKFAILAPSAHNTQPWNFSIRDNSIIILKNQKRLLKQGDSLTRQFYISIGCMLENVTIAANFYGLNSGIFYFNNGNKIARINFSFLSPNKDDNHLIHQIINRCTNRGKFKKELPVASFVKEIEKESGKGIKVFVIDDKEKDEKDSIADIVNLAQIESMDSDDFREELSHYVKPNFTKEKIGMPGFALGVPAFISLFLAKLIKKKNMSRVSQKKDIALLKEHTPLFIIICGEKDTQEYWVSAGHVMERIWLMAEKYGLSCAPFAAAIEHKDYYKKLQEILGTSMRPLVFLRAGYAIKKAFHSPRFTVNELLI